MHFTTICEKEVQGMIVFRKVDLSGDSRYRVRAKIKFSCWHHGSLRHGMRHGMTVTLHSRADNEAARLMMKQAHR
jgi:hypothetical protein